MTDGVIDTAIFHRLELATANKPSELVELCRDYLSETRETVTQLEGAAAASEADKVRERAHYLKGGSLMIGAKGVAQCCVTLEEMGRAKDFGGVKQVLELMKAELSAVEAELNSRLGPGAVSAEGSAA